MARQVSTIYYIVIGILISILVFGTLRALSIHGEEEVSKINFGEFSVALGTFILALATFHLANIEIDESKKEREYNRLREKAFFYSRLMSGMSESEIEFDDLKEMPHTIKHSYFKFLETNSYIYSNFPLLSEPELNKILSKIMPIVTDSRELHSFDKVKDDIPEVIYLIHKDFEKLKDKYNEF